MSLRVCLLYSTKMRTENTNFVFNFSLTLPIESLTRWNFSMFVFSTSFSCNQYSASPSRLIFPLIYKLYNKIYKFNQTMLRIEFLIEWVYIPISVKYSYIVDIKICEQCSLEELRISHVSIDKYLNYKILKLSWYFRLIGHFD